MSAKETSLEFVDRMEADYPKGFTGFTSVTSEEYQNLIRLAKTAALIDEHRLGINPWSAYWDVQHRSGHYTEADDLHTAVRAVADKIRKEQA